MKTFNELLETIKVPMNSKHKETDEIDSIGNGLHDHSPMNPDESGAVSNYSSSEFVPINKELREDYKHSHTTQDRADNINSAIKKHVTKEPSVVWRIINHTSPHLLSGANPGDTVRDKGFISTTLSGDYAKKFIDASNQFGEDGHIAKIHLPKGSNALYLNQADLSHHYMEHEVLLPSGSRFKYDKKRTVGNITVHHMTHIPGNK
jgi:hypothetical protein